MADDIKRHRWERVEEKERRERYRERLGRKGREGRSVLLPQPLLFSTTSLAMRKRLFCGKSFVLQEYIYIYIYIADTLIHEHIDMSSYPFNRSVHIAHKPTSAFSRSISQTLTLTHGYVRKHKIFSLVSCYGAAVAVSFHCLQRTHTLSYMAFGSGIILDAMFIANKCGILLIVAIKRVKHYNAVLNVNCVFNLCFSVGFAAPQSCIERRFIFWQHFSGAPAILQRIFQIVFD